ncbi:osteoclast-stimulating factor 1-like [Palaemon carinicauda]|uniref:osteoclast-stimulating factor 1-like n=1 Tax=Palaemon carinicauda TaxID=392227 RepID=UPI0035B63021
MSQPHRPAPPPPPVRKGQVQAFEALGSYKAKRDCELSFEEGDILFVVDRSDTNWWQAKLDNKSGYIPSNYVKSDNVKTPIIDAARRGNLEMVEECLAAGISVNSLDKTGSSALHAASQGGHLHCVTRLLREPRIEINLQNKLGDTPLHCAAVRGHTDVVQLLIQHKANASVVNRDNCTPRKLAKRESVIAAIEEATVNINHEPLNYDNNDYGIDESEDSDE